MAEMQTSSNLTQPLPPVPSSNVGSTERLITLLAGAALLGYAWRNRSRRLGLASTGLLLRGATGYCPAYAAMGVNKTDTKEALSAHRGVHVRESIVINAPAEDIYKFWRQLDRLPGVMPHLERVEELDARRSRWTMKALDRVPLTWTAEIINDVPSETIGWKTMPGETIQHAGSVTFKPSPTGRGTDVRVHLQYAAPGGRAASWLAWLAGEDPAELTRAGLRELKRRIEGPHEDFVRPQPSLAPAPIH